MPRIGNRTSFDLWFPSVSLGLRILQHQPNMPWWRFPVWQGGAGPAEVNEDLLAKRTVPTIWHNRGKGMGVSQFDDDTSNDGDYDYGLNLYSRTPGSFMPAGAATEVVISGVSGVGACTSSAVYNNTDLFFGFGRYVLKVAAGTDPGPIVSAERDLGVGFSAKRMQMYEGVLYVGGSGGFMWRYNGGWTQSADTSALDLASVYWVTPDGVGSQRLIIQDTATSFKHIAEGSTPLVLASYSARYQVAGGTYTINSIVTANQIAWFATSGGLASVDGRGYSPVINPYLAQQFSSSLNGEASVVFDDYVYMSHLQGIDRVYVGAAIKQYRPGFVQPGYGTSAEGPIYGRCTAMCVEGGYILAAIYNGTDSYLMAGDPTPQGRMVWHGAELKLAGERITHLRVHSTSPASNPCVWIASVAGSTPKLRYLSIPKAATPQQELLNNLNAAGTYTGSHRWATSSSIYFGAVDLGDQNAQKIVERYDTSARRLDSNTYLRVFANAEGGSYIQQGTGADPKIATSPRGQLIPTAPLNSAYNLGVRVDAVGTSTAPWLLNELKGRFEVIQPLRNSKTYQVELGPAPDTRLGATLDQDVQDDLNALLALQSSGPVAMIDEMGNTLPAVKVEPGISWMPKRVTREGENAEAWVIVATVTITTVPTTEEALTSSTTSPPATALPQLVWDEGAWDDASWS